MLVMIGPGLEFQPAHLDDAATSDCIVEIALHVYLQRLCCNEFRVCAALSLLFET